MQGENLSTLIARFQLPGTLWRNPAFMRLWAAQILSGAGSEVSHVAIPLTAVLVLNATAAQMGWLNIAGSLPNVLFALFAGVWVDRLPRRPVLIASDLGRALLIATIPLAAIPGYLSFAHLLVVIFAMATLNLIFIIASVSILPSIAEAEQLVEANSKLATSDSTLAIVGPSLGGVLTQLLSAPIAIVLDAISYLLSALLLGGIAVSETPQRTERERGHLWGEIAAGLRELVRTPLLRALTLSSGVGSFGGGMFGTVLVLFLARGLDLTPAAIGLVFSLRGVGSLLGAISAGQIAQWIGIGRTIILSSFFWGFGGVVMALAGVVGMDLVFLGVGQMLMGVGATVYSVNQMSLRQVVTPVAVLGRVTAARRLLIFGMAAAGAALAGFLGGQIDLRIVMASGALILCAGSLIVFLSPVRTYTTGMEAKER
jgi:MFS family permease